MTERLLQFLWQFQCINHNGLCTNEGEGITIIKPGIKNHNQGADFLNAQIKIGETVWAGNVELHLKSSLWSRHGHQSDPNYSNVILHVVWEHDSDAVDLDGNVLQVLSLSGRVALTVIQRFDRLMAKKGFPCQADLLPRLSSLEWMAWKERLAVERLERKAAVVIGVYEQTGNHWEEAFWRVLCANFGSKINKDLFAEIANTVGINILGKHRNNLQQLESILLGQANLLEGEFETPYAQGLKKEYLFLAAKYKLAKVHIRPDFLRMRPASFPSVRLAQLAGLVEKSTHLFSKVTSCKDIKELRALFDVTASRYWDNHYTLDQFSKHSPKRMGDDMIDNIIINSIAPLLFAYGTMHQEEKMKDLAIKWLEATQPEKNKITDNWANYGQTMENAFDSQAFIELTTQYCDNRRCLDCTVGMKIMRTEM